MRRKPLSPDWSARWTHCRLERSSPIGDFAYGDDHQFGTRYLGRKSRTTLCRVLMGPVRGAIAFSTTGQPLRRASYQNPPLSARNNTSILANHIFPRNRCNLFAMEEPLDSWFKREILGHEESLVRFLYRIWPRHQEVNDLRQDVYVRVYEAAITSRPLAPKSFLFAAARNLITDRIRRQRIVSIDAVEDLDALNVMVDHISMERRVSAYQELRRLAEAIDRLPPKCRETVWLRRVEDMSQKEVAERLGVAQKTVEKHVMKGMKLLAAAMHRSELERSPGAGESRSEHDEQAHGKP